MKDVIEMIRANPTDLLVLFCLLIALFALRSAWMQGR